jgi:hypothetical protein
MSKKKTTARVTGPKTSYTAVSSNIYYDGYSYRVRMSIDGVRYSKNFSSKTAAVKFRNQLQQRALAA